MSLQNLYLSWGEILSPNWKASWSFYTHGRHTQGQCLGMYGDQAASSVEEEKRALNSSPGTVGRSTPDANLFCLQAVKPAFSFHYNLQESPLESAGVPLVLSAPQFSHLGIVLQPSRVPQEGAHLKLLFLFLLLLASLSPASTLSRGLKQQSHSANTPAA